MPGSDYTPARPWQVLRSFNIEGGLVQAIQALYENSSSAVLLNSQLREFFKTTVGVPQRRLLSPILFNLFLEKIMKETLHDHHVSISIGGRSICNLRFAEGINLDSYFFSSNGELQGLTNRLVDRARAYGKEVSTEKSKIMTNSTHNISANISMNGEEVTSFKYLGATL